MRSAAVAALIGAILVLWACPSMPPGAKPGKPAVVATVFPLYDFTRSIAGDRADVRMLLPPASEPHSFEPRPADIVAIHSATLFIYVNPEMEPWARNLVKNTPPGKPQIIEASAGITATEPASPHGHGGHAHGRDPHLWLDLSNAIRMVGTIRDGLIRTDPDGAAVYRKNAADYEARLHALDEKFREGLSDCRKRIIVNSGHFAFDYMARRYGFRYLSVYGVSPDAEPTAPDLARVTNTLRSNGLHYLFYEELLSPRLGQTIARETGAQFLMLNSADTVTKEQFDRGITFIELMERNLDNLRTGMECR